MSRVNFNEINFFTLQNDFPILKQSVYDKPLVYLDNAATTQKPTAVLDAIRYYYEHDNANVHRGIHLLAARSDADYAKARDKVAKFINAQNASEIVFVRGTTEAINLVAQTYGRQFLKRGDKILCSVMEHHSNIVPWQMLREEININLHQIPLVDSCDIDMQAYKALLSEKPKLVAITHASNVLGAVNPIKEMVALAHEVGSLVLVDGAQAVAHMAVDVQDLDADFYVFSGHKMYAPTGIGVLYAKGELLNKMQPYQVGGGMIAKVSFDETGFAEAPEKFEAGTPNIAGAIGLAAAIDYLNSIGMSNIAEHEAGLMRVLLPELERINDVHVIGNPEQRIAVLSLVVDGVHPHDVGTILDRDGIAVRAGHHCAMPLMQHLQLPATTRVSFGIYNHDAEIAVLIESLEKIKRLFKNG